MKRNRWIVMASLLVLTLAVAPASFAAKGGNDPKEYPGQGATFVYDLSCSIGGLTIAVPLDIGASIKSPALAAPLIAAVEVAVDAATGIPGWECTLEGVTNPGGKTKDK